MTKTLIVVFVLCSLLFIPLGPQPVEAKPNASVKFSLSRAENQGKTKETLVLPYAFPSESMGFSAGVGGLAKGFGQDQLLVAAAGWASVDEALGLVAGLWDYQLPIGQRLFFTTFGSIGHYPRLRAFSEVPRTTDPKRAGANDSDENDFIEEEGDDNWWDVKLEYVLPIGSMKHSSMAEYQLKNGLLTSGASGGGPWNPLEGGVSVLVLRQFNRHQEFNTASGTIEGTIHPVEFGLLYNNTDFFSNPSRGSSQYLSYTQDFGWGESEVKWNFLSFEASKYFDLGPTSLARQQVLALNVWTGNSLSWDTETRPDGTEVVVDAPPYLEGATLGGFYRMKAYPTNRFNDRAVVYTAGEYRFAPHWNPVAGVDWLNFLKLDWFQLVGFAEGGRVAGEYDLDELTSDWKFDGGIGLRALVAGGVVRFDVAVGDEGTNAWVMFGQPF
jgi:hypothetical protein